MRDTARGAIRGAAQLVVLSDDVMIDVLEELELDGFAESIGRLDPVEDDATGASREMLVEKAGGAAEDPGQVGLPFVPLVRLEVPSGHAAARAIDGMEVIADRLGEIPSRSKSGVASGDTRQIPSR